MDLMINNYHYEFSYRKCKDLTTRDVFVSNNRKCKETIALLETKIIDCNETASKHVAEQGLEGRACLME